MMPGDRKRNTNILKVVRFGGARLFVVGPLPLNAQTSKHLLKLKPILAEIMQQSSHPGTVRQAALRIPRPDSICSGKQGDVSEMFG